MEFKNLSTKAKTRAIEEVVHHMKIYSEQRYNLRVNDMKEFISENKLKFDINGNII